MENEKLKEIKKALEFNANEDIYVLPYVDDKDEQNIVDFNDILTLINELESENERLIAEKQKVLEYMKTDNYSKLKKEDMYWGYQMGIGMLEHEIDRQKYRIAELEQTNETLKDEIKEIDKLERRIKELEGGYARGYADGIKNTYEAMLPQKLENFAERLKEKADGLCIKNDILYAIKSSDIDETLKEFRG